MSITLYSAVIIVVDVKLAVHTHLWTLANAIALFVFSILLYYGYVVISEYLGTQVADTPLTLMRSPNYWLVIILVSIIVWSIDQALNSYHKFKDLSFKSAMRKFHINFIKLLYKKKEITSEHLKKIIVLVKWQGESFLIGKKLL